MKRSRDARHRKKVQVQTKFRYQIVRATPSGALLDLTPSELSTFEARYPSISARWQTDPSRCAGHPFAHMFHARCAHRLTEIVFFVFLRSHPFSHLSHTHSPHIPAFSPPPPLLTPFPHMSHPIRPTYHRNMCFSLSWEEQCKRLLSTLMSNKIAEPFNVPVDPVALGLPDYFSVIKTPMDMGTIKTRLHGSF